MKPAKRWLAVVLSLLLAGLGHVYAGRPGRAVLIVALVQLCLLPSLAVIMIIAGTTPAILLVSGATAVALTAAIAWDASRFSRNERPRLRSRSALVAALLTFTVAASVVGEVSKTARDVLIGRAYRSPSEAMIPTLLLGDHFLADAMSLKRQPISRGDLVVFRVAREEGRVFPVDERPDLPRDLFIKRVVGLPRDEIEIGRDGLSVNGLLITQAARVGRIDDSDGRQLDLYAEALDGHQYQVARDSSRSTGDFGPFEIPEDRYFLLGDNRDSSNDSRYWGTILHEDIVGRATTIYWSWDFDGSTVRLLDPRTWFDLLSSHTRWSRIGERLQ